MMGGSCTNICYHNQMYLLLKRKRLNTVALRITEAKHIIAGASCVSVSIGACSTIICWLSSQRCLRIGINVSNPIARERLHLRRVWLSSISIWRSWRWIFVTNPIIGVSPWGLHLLEMDLYATYLITRVHLLPRAAVSCAIVSNQACWLSSMPAGSSGSWLSSLLIVIIPDCHHCWLSSLRAGSSSGCLLGATWICNCLYLEEHTCEGGGTRLIHSPTKYCDPGTDCYASPSSGYIARIHTGKTPHLPALLCTFTRGDNGRPVILRAMYD